MVTASHCTETQMPTLAPLIQDLCASVDVASMWRHLEHFSRYVKLSGSKEELESLAEVRAELERCGLATNLILHDAYVSLPGAASVVLDGGSPACITHSFSRASGPAGVTGTLVYAGAGGPADLDGIDCAGRILLLDGIATPAASLRASRAGAIGQLHFAAIEHVYEMCISPVWGSPMPDQRHLLPRTVVLSVMHSTGEGLKHRLQSGETIELTLHAEVDTGWRKTPILEADLPAPNAPDDGFVLFSGHHDTWHHGVMDNGTANAVMLEVARLFASRRHDLKRGLRLCFWSGHSHGRYSGSSWYADSRFRELERRCVAHVNVDSPGARGNTVLSDALSSHELFGLAADAVKQQGGQELAGHRMSRAGDQSFWGIGIPSLFMGMGEQPAGSANSIMGPAVGSSGTRNGAGFGWWWPTPDDTLDKIDPDLLVRDARIYVHAIARLLTEPVLPLDVARQADALHDQVAGLAGRLGDRLDLTPLLADAASLRSAARALMTRAEAGEDVPAVNQALVAVTRALVPIDYTGGDRFTPGPALPQGTSPALEPLRVLAAAPAGSDDALFAAVAARRAANRVAVAIGEALRGSGVR